MVLALCIAGCGRYARTIAGVISSMDNQVELFFASRDRDKAKECCRIFKGRDYFGSYEDAARDRRVEAMYFCTPHHRHCENVLMAARHSKHILVEKPVARNLEEAQRIVQAATLASVKLMVAENARFIPAMLRCKELIDQGAIGALRLVQVQAEQRYTPTGWRSALEMNGGGAFIDGGIHSVDNLVYLAGMPVRLYACAQPKVLHQVEGEDGIVMMAEMDNGAVGLINFSWGNLHLSGQPWIAVTGARGRIYLDLTKGTLTLDTGIEQKQYQFSENDFGRKSMVLEFVEAVRQNRPPAFSGEEAMRDLVVVLKAYESIKSSLPVTIG